MSGFATSPHIFIRDDGVTFEMVRPCTYYGSQGDHWTIPEGFRTDFATIPAAVSWAIPKLGAYTLAAIVHDLLCEGLNDWRRAVDYGLGYLPDNMGRPRRTYEGRVINYPTATAVDTDAIFYKIARDLGTDPVTAALLWVGVRWGALANPARREGWLRTAPKVIGLSVLFAPVLVPATVLALVGRGVLRVVRAVNRLLTRKWTA